MKYLLILLVLLSFNAIASEQCRELYEDIGALRTQIAEIAEEEKLIIKDYNECQADVIGLDYDKDKAKK